MGTDTSHTEYFSEGARRHMARLRKQCSRDQPGDMLPLEVSGQYGGDLLAVAKCPRCGRRICWNEEEPGRKEQWWPDDSRWWAKCCGMRWEVEGIMFHVTVSRGA